MKQTGAAIAKPHEPSMEEILASIRRIIADDEESSRTLEPRRPTRAEPATPRPVPPDEGSAGLDLAVSVDSPRPPQATSSPADKENAERHGRNGVGREPPAHEPDIAEVGTAPPTAPDSRARPDPGAERLLSGETDAQVSRNFNMLATTVLSNNARTLEDLVKEMLRPMLKTWLDDNLPPLVERLVRVEIERVARGGG